MHEIGTRWLLSKCQRLVPSNISLLLHKLDKLLLFLLLLLFENRKNHIKNTHRVVDFIDDSLLENKTQRKIIPGNLP